RAPSRVCRAVGSIRRKHVSDHQSFRKNKRAGGPLLRVTDGDGDNRDRSRMKRYGDDWVFETAAEGAVTEGVNELIWPGAILHQSKYLLGRQRLPLLDRRGGCGEAADGVVVQVPVSDSPFGVKFD